MIKLLIEDVKKHLLWYLLLAAGLAFVIAGILTRKDNAILLGVGLEVVALLPLSIAWYKQSMPEN